ncbi:dipeptidyl aminopeptidase [Crepidotus variabilis]|uniref:Dipeptidyl aminopeptidase n=1 Tax=Crepidotus variabilis TaxID=179855 RepID=A0A9P6JQR9_9AGAR|nr:dipeptidyl aminopeptidase [Crepidotus variabilis]
MRQLNTSGAIVDPLVTKPQIYYGEGPFDPPSSDDEDEEERVNARIHDFEDDAETISLLSTSPMSPGRAERGVEMSSRPKEKYTPARILGFVLIGLVSLAAVIGVVAGFAYSATSYRAPGRKKITMDHVFNGTFWPSAPELNWVVEAGDGVFSQLTDGQIKLVDLKNNKTTVVVSTLDIKDESGWILPIYDWKLSDDMNHLLIKGASQKQWRHSSFGNYYIHNIAEKTTRPLIEPSSPPKTAYATWAPTGSAIAYVVENDLYVLPSAVDTNSIRVTSNGNASLFNGVPDWVYEEEVYSSNFVLWWSPDSTKLAYLSLDETAVPEFSFPIYNPTEDNNAVVPYTSNYVIKYPKPGYPNPLVSVHVFDLDVYNGGDTHGGLPAEDSTLTLDWDGRHPVTDSIVQEVTWVGNSSLILKEVNRNADAGSVVLFEFEGSSTQRGKGKVVRNLGKQGEQGDDGWIDHEHTIYPIPDAGVLSSFKSTSAYLDIVPSADGHNHIALFNPADSSTPQFLTSGEWEVTGGIQGVDPKKGLVYFTAAKPSTERHILSVPIPTSKSEKAVEPKALTDTTKPGYYAAKFSPEAGFYVLTYSGPNTPWTKVVTVDSSNELVLEKNEQLNNITAQYESATVVYSTIMSDGYELNVKEIRPPRMDDSGRTKYPVLFRVYGGPASQMVDLTFSRDWHYYLACDFKYIIVTVDGRGTGFKGRKLRNVVKSNLGFFETIDQINAAKAWAKKPYVDPKKIGIWGWSYGGFMTSKVVEANAKIHSLAMAVAPVTSWKLYDSIYTERYMNLPALNEGGYVNASISHVEGFKEVDYLLAHGSGDDNVHYANSAHLLDMFVKGQVRKYRFRMFTDSDHSIRRRGANREIYEYLTGFLLEKWGKGGRRV